MAKKIYTIDGNRFSDLQGFHGEIGAVLIPGVAWGKNLDAFNDILRGGFGTPDEGFILVWENARRSRDVFDMHLRSISLKPHGNNKLKGLPMKN